MDMPIRDKSLQHYCSVGLVWVIIAPSGSYRWSLSHTMITAPSGPYSSLSRTMIIAPLGPYSSRIHF